MERSFASRVRGAAQRWRHRWVYEHIRPEPSVADVLARVDSMDAAAAAVAPFSRVFAAHLALTPRVLWTHWPSETGDAVEQAREGKWTLLGRAIDVTPEIDWHRDPFFGGRWQRRYVGALSYHRPGGDLVTLWHLNKTTFLLELAAAYKTTGDAALAARVYDIIDSWCVANPYLVGINWASPLDIATRLAVWSQALAAVAEASPPDEERAARIVRSILRQADHVASHFSEWPIPNNHLMGEAALLYVFATYWPVWKDSPAWLRRAEAILVAEAQRQVLKDGIQYEASVNYHAYVLDFLLMYLHAKALLAQPPHPVLLSKARAMAVAMMELKMPSGRLPRIGDDTIDRCFVLAHALDAPPLSPNASAFADCLRPAYARLFASTPWGRDLVDIRVPTQHARHFAEAGISVARDSRAAVVFTHGPQHRHLFSHGHLHADAGSFELELDSTPVVVDAGTYVYFVDPQARTYFKSASAHNAPVIDDIEPMRSMETFRWETVAAGECLGFGAHEDAVAIGNRRKLQGLSGAHLDHTRVLVICSGTVLILDRIRAREQTVEPHAHVARVCFRTPTPPASATAEGSRVRVADPRRFVRVLESFADQPLRVDAIDDPGNRACWYSRWYGDLQHGVAVVVQAEFESLVTILSVVRNTDVSVVPMRLGAANVMVAIESHDARRLVQVQVEPFAVTVGGRMLAGRGTDAARLSHARAVAAPPSSSPPAWLDELAGGSL